MTEMNKLLNSLGFGFPKSSEEIKMFREVFENFDFKTRSENINTAYILKKAFEIDHESTSNSFFSSSETDNVLRTISQTSKIEKPSRNDFHKRTVLAAELVFQLHTEWSLGHVKLQKLIFLCQEVNGMAIHTNFLRQAMGPYDPKLMRSIDSQFQKQKWFTFNRNSPQKYSPLEKCGGHQKWFNRYYSDHKDGIYSLIDTFRKVKTEKVELVGTIYACWLSLSSSQDIYSRQNILTLLYSWSEEKSKFSQDQALKAIDWMLEKKICPKSHRAFVD